jgi:hypothetical protein
MKKLFFLGFIIFLLPTVHASETVEHCIKSTNDFCFIEHKGEVYLPDFSADGYWYDKIKLDFQLLTTEKFNNLKSQSTKIMIHSLKNSQHYVDISCVAEPVDGKCIAGTVGGAAVGGLAGASSPVAGGTIIGTIGGAIVGSINSVCWD